jgi:hypothetical protein
MTMTVDMTFAGTPLCLQSVTNQTSRHRYITGGDAGGSEGGGGVMIKTLLLLTTPVLGATPSVILTHSDSCTCRDRNEVLLIRLMPKDVAHRAVAAY